MIKDNTPIKTQSHPKDSILGASLLLEALLPELTTEQITRASVGLARAMADIKSSPNTCEGCNLGVKPSTFHQPDCEKFILK